MSTKAKVNKFLLALCVLVLCWTIFVIAAPAIGDGLMYHVTQPVRVTQVGLERVDLSMSQWAVWDMVGTCSLKLECDTVAFFPTRDCSIEDGYQQWSEKMLFAAYAVVDWGTGQAQCHYTGATEYAPFGSIGPRMVYTWTSEMFIVERLEEP